MACGGGSAPPTGGQPVRTRAAVIAVDGSSTVFPVTEAVAEEFQKANAGTQVTVGRSGTGGGFQKFCRGETRHLQRVAADHRAGNRGLPEGRD